MKTREQQRMALAVRKVGVMAKSEHREDYGRACFTFAPLVRSAGLCQAVAFFGTRKEGHQEYLQHLDEHLREAELVGKDQRLSDAAVAASVTGYLLLTREALACALWHKRLAQSELGMEPTSDEAS